MKVIFDFDDTIFDTNKFKTQVLFKIFEEVNQEIDARVIEGEYNIFRKVNRVFSLDKFLEGVILKYNLADAVDLYDLYKIIEIGIKDCLITDYEKIIKKLGKDSVVILSQGDVKFQKLKMDLSGITNMVSEVVIVDDSKVNFITEYCKKNLNNKVYFVDDKLENFISEDLPSNLIQVLVSKKSNIDKESLKGMVISIKEPIDLTRVFLLTEISKRLK